MAPVAHRDVSPLLQLLRSFLLGRPHKKALRFADGISARTQPPPVLPDGPHCKLSQNAYCSRDARRESQPPLLIVDGADVAKLLSSKAITSGQDVAGSDVTIKTPTLGGSPVPGVPYEWKMSKDSR